MPNEGNSIGLKITLSALPDPMVNRAAWEAGTFEPLTNPAEVEVRVLTPGNVWLAPLLLSLNQVANLGGGVFWVVIELSEEGRYWVLARGRTIAGREVSTAEWITASAIE